MAEFRFSDNCVYIKSKSFDLRQTLDCGQAFRFSCDESGMWKGVVFGKVVCLYKDGDEIVLKNVNEQEFYDKFYSYFTFDLDYTKIKKEFSKDNRLKTACEVSSGIRMLRQEKFETVCSFIFSQNNNIPRIKGIIERFCFLFGEKIDEENYAFPTVERIANLTVEDLSPIRAGFRAKYIIDAAQKIASGEVDLEKLETLSLQEARESLMKIKGIGPKVADCVLLFSCSQFSAFPMDVWMKKVMSTHFEDGLPSCTKGYEGIAQQYLFDWARSLDN